MSILTQLSLTAVVALSLNAAADEPKAAPQAQRTVLERHDQSGVPGKEIVIGSAILPAGTAIGYHTHPGDEAGYVLQGYLDIEGPRTAGSHAQGRQQFLHSAGCSAQPRCYPGRGRRNCRIHVDH